MNPDLPCPPAPVMQSPPGAETVIDGRQYWYFGGTGYLGLAGHPEVIEAACAATRQYGVHTATSRSGFGTSPLTLAVEQGAAEWFGLEHAFYFSSGYMAHHVLLPPLLRPATLVFIDDAAHFCVEEAARLSLRPVIRFRHRDPNDLARLLRIHLMAGQEPLVLTDGVFPATGALAPVADYSCVLSDYTGAALVIDDAHGLGVLGDQGRGLLEHAGRWGPAVNRDAETNGVRYHVAGTLSKALGGFGGIVPGSRAFIARVRSGSHYYEGASAPPAAAAGASAKALEIVRREPALRLRLADNIRQLRSGLRALGLPVEDSPAANIGVPIGDAATMRRIHEALRARGYLVPYIAAYSGTGPEGLLRIAACALHTPKMIRGLLDELGRLL